MTMVPRSKPRPSESVTRNIGGAIVKIEQIVTARKTVALRISGRIDFFAIQPLERLQSRATGE
jgi:hypothetical protein